MTAPHDTKTAEFDSFKTLESGGIKPSTTVDDTEPADQAALARVWSRIQEGIAA